MQPINSFPCRVCAAVVVGKPLAVYAGMPAVAQHLPAAEDLGTDHGVDLELHQCPACGVVQLSQDPVPYYREVIRATGISAGMREFRTAQFADWVERHKVRGHRLVEIGCGHGEYLELMREAGADTYGIEFSPVAVDACLRRGLPVQQGFVDSATCTLADGPFDAFMMLSFLEHLPQPVATLRGIAANLAPGAVGLVEVPNFEMIAQHDLFAEITSDHLLYFTAETLASTLAISGFQLLDCQPVWSGYILSATVRKRPRLELACWAAKHRRLGGELDAYVRQFAPGRVAAWGAGHQALAVLAMANLGGKIRYVVDSAPFKQGRFTPATHVPIVAPDMLERDPVDAVIVMAASYSREVVHALVERFPAGLGIAVLEPAGLKIVSAPPANGTPGCPLRTARTELAERLGGNRPAIAPDPPIHR